MLRCILCSLLLCMPVISYAYLSASEEITILNIALENLTGDDALAKKLHESIVDRELIDDDNYILINIASRQLIIVKNSKSISSQQVIVGRPDRPTPIFSDSLEYIIIDPYWVVPRSIVKSELLPIIDIDPSFLAKGGYEVINTATNRVVTYAQGMNLRNHIFRQRPSKLNVLGTYKFIFNPTPGRDIYLHDTPDKTLFDDVRQYSAGNIRLEDAESLASYLLDKPLPESVNQNMLFKLPVPMPVHVVNWPIYVMDNNIIVTEFR